MDFLNHREGAMVFYQVFLLFLYRNCKRLREFDEIEISSKAVEVTVNIKEDFCLDFVQEFGLRKGTKKTIRTLRIRIRDAC